MKRISGLQRTAFNFMVRWKNKNEKRRMPCSLKSAKKIGILFPAGNIKANDVVLAFAQQLKAGMKDVQLLGYLEKREFGFVYPFPFITRKDLNWFGKPVDKNSGYFMHSPFDLIINFSTEACAPLDYISAISHSQFRVCFNAGADMKNYDLILIPGNADIHSRIKNLHTYLLK
jgi:hypothetical protein